MTTKKWCGYEISDYGIQNNRVDYYCFSKTFDSILANNLMEDTYSIGEWEQVNGFIDNSDEIDELTEQIESAQERIDELDEIDDGSAVVQLDREELEEQIWNCERDIDRLRDEEDYPPDVFQWYIVDDYGADIIKRFIDGILYYNSALDLYLWGVTHVGTSWRYVLTPIKIENEVENEPELHGERM